MPRSWWIKDCSYMQRYNVRLLDRVPACYSALSCDDLSDGKRSRTNSAVETASSSNINHTFVTAIRLVLYKCFSIIENSIDGTSATREKEEFDERGWEISFRQHVISSPRYKDILSWPWTKYPYNGCFLVFCHHVQRVLVAFTCARTI